VIGEIALLEAHLDKIFDISLNRPSALQ